MNETQFWKLANHHENSGKASVSGTAGQVMKSMFSQSVIPFESTKCTA
ncbi:hypothetical protein [Thiolapillus sp.]|nr:hypothetical protein [Thiolapillus sp.]